MIFFSHYRNSTLFGQHFGWLLKKDEQEAWSSHTKVGPDSVTLFESSSFQMKCRSWPQLAYICYIKL